MFHVVPEIRTGTRRHGNLARRGAAGSLSGARGLYERVWDPAVVFARRMLEDPELAPLLGPALTAKLAQEPPTCAALAQAMRTVALEVGPATMVRTRPPPQA